MNQTARSAIHPSGRITLLAVLAVVAVVSIAGLFFASFFKAPEDPANDEIPAPLTVGEELRAEERQLKREVAELEDILLADTNPKHGDPVPLITRIELQAIENVNGQELDPPPGHEALYREVVILRENWDLLQQEMTRRSRGRTKGPPAKNRRLRRPAQQPSARIVRQNLVGPWVEATVQLDNPTADAITMRLDFRVRFCRAVEGLDGREILTSEWVELALELVAVEGGDAFEEIFSLPLADVTLSDATVCKVRLYSGIV